MTARPWLVPAVLLLATVGWSVVTHPLAPSVAEHAVAWFLLALALVAGRRAAVTLPHVTPVLVAAAVLLGFLAGLPDSMTTQLRGPPLSYANANAYLLLLAAAALLLGVRQRTVRVRWVAWTAVLAVVVICFLAQALAAGACAVALLVWEAVRFRVGPRTSFLAAAGVLMLGTAATVLGGLRPDLVPVPVVRALSYERFLLWSDALDLASSHRIEGVGAGRFVSLSRLASSDSDLAWVHSAPLQQLAEQGYVGLALAAALTCSVLVLLRRDAVLGAVLLLPALVDYVLDFSSTLLALGLLLGVLSRSSATGTGKPWLTPPSP